jgi:CRISPR-associated protein Csm3
VHKRILNEMTLVFDISPHDAPLLIKSGREAGADPTVPDLNFVRTTHPQSGGRVVYLPGSSLKGTLRSYAERIARSVRPDGRRAWCCATFGDGSCGSILKDEKSAAARYAEACTICRTFGHTRLGSHLAVTDAYPTGDVKIEQRDGVAIDRISGAVSAGPFNMEVVSQGSFRTTVTLRNFQLWQIGLLAITLRDLGDGMVPIGSGKSKGFGRTSLQYVSARVAYPGQWQAERDGRSYAANLYDLADFAFEDRESYRLAPVPAASVALAGEPAEAGDYGRVVVALADDAAIRALLLSTVGHWKHAVECWPAAA